MRNGALNSTHFQYGVCTQANWFNILNPTSPFLKTSPSKGINYLWPKFNKTNCKQTILPIFGPKQIATENLLVSKCGNREILTYFRKTYSQYWPNVIPFTFSQLIYILSSHNHITDTLKHFGILSHQILSLDWFSKLSETKFGHLIWSPLKMQTPNFNRFEFFLLRCIYVVM